MSLVLPLCLILAVTLAAVTVPLTPVRTVCRGHLPLILILLAGHVAAAPLTNSINGNIGLAWDYDSNQLGTNLSFNIYGTTNLAQPVSQWSLLTNVPGTNLSCVLPLAPGQYFFVATASNFWGETSITSNQVGTPSVPQPINNSLKISKVP